MSLDLIHAAIADAEAALAKTKTLLGELFGDAEHDAEQVATTAATSGLDAAAHQAEGDVATLAQTAVTDATASTPAASTPAASTPAAPAADVTTPPAAQ